MMTNLFSTFDPSTSIKFSLNWISMMLFFLFPVTFWMKKSRFKMMMSVIINFLLNELKITLNFKSKEIILILMSTFMLILINNMMGLLPYIFTATSHMLTNLSIALPLWLSIMLFSWTNKTKIMLIHLTPLGTPEPIMPFMVMIEMISNLIRPISLSVRLTANMITGHLLMTLLETSMQLKNLPIISIQMFLMSFEVAVAFIQAYVFSMLMTLYISEVNYVK
uniref:ATP synthase subunit a n=1 Tax=Pseudacysta perseae TaxID=1041453 RepID=A0A089RZW8_PSEPZ|nr:ATP synthase F0 subunit 6 [Pseudacysta perseae]AIR11945.1 ATP synthase F0 subunit 6 [Pseudacysta perseae]